ncbi:MAG: hypothetical protein A4E59_00773 [Syntrophorhabdus sp. PtaB.Bin027]|nr:MAG: hypothetical protein A4E59_00773 [Syntrophorhabdus sp. PtaB.Bin027]HQB33486.1 YjbH domain-containing protein [Syntrophorhabdus sp.]
MTDLILPYLLIHCVDIGSGLLHHIILYPFRIIFQISLWRSLFFCLARFLRFNILHALLACLALLVFTSFPALPPFPFFPPVAYAADEPFLGSANWGGTGLMEIPTARVMKENTYRFGFAEVSPYRYYYGALGLFPGLEVDGRVTEVVGVKAFETPSSGWYRDKAFDVKYRFLPESKYGPALALGIMDPQGTRLYPSQYLVASKQIYPFDFTIGFGNGRFGKKPLAPSNEDIKAEIFTDPKRWFKESQIFWGVQFSPSDRYSFMMEYSPIKFHKQISDPARRKYFDKAVPSGFNFGFRWKPFKWAEVDVSYQRGEQFSLNLSTLFEIGKPLIPIYDESYKEKADDKGYSVETRLINALFASGFSNIQVKINVTDVFVEAQNNRYFYVTKAIGIILKLVNDITPRHVENIHIIINDNGIPLFKFSAMRADIGDWQTEKLSNDELIYLSSFDPSITGGSDTRVFHRSLIDYGAKMSIENYYDVADFFQYRFGLAAWGSYRPWKGATFLAQPEWYPINNISTRTLPLVDAVRSDFALYKEKDVTLARLMFDQTYKATNQLYSRISAGYLELQYAGIYGEIATTIVDGRIMFGLGGSAVRKRDPDNVLKLSDHYTQIYKTAFFNSRLNIPEYDVTLDMKAGRFLAGDIGAKFTISKFIKGVTISAWYSITDTSNLKDPLNRGYHDKGISIAIPIRIFRGSDSKTSYTYVLSPWTRDVAQDVNQYESLFDFIGRNIKIFFDKDSKWLN